MANLFQYLKEYGQKSFRESPLNVVDNFIFSQLSYINYDGVVEGKESVNMIEGNAKYFSINPTISSLGLVIPPEIIELFKVLPMYSRYSDVFLSDYVNIISNEIQFSAITFHLPTGEVYVAFRGTDDTIVGWKEDFMLCYGEVPAQKEAVKYINRIGRAYPTKLYICGHSKGGNLAVYSAAKCDKEVQDRIVNVYNNDGPGFCDDFYHGDEYAVIADKVVGIVPQGSIVGMLLEHADDYYIIQSTYKGVFQHNVFSWQIEGDHPVPVDDRTRESYFLDKSMREALRQMEFEERREFVDAFFKAIDAAKVENLVEVPDKILDLIHQAVQLDKKYKKLLAGVVGKFLKSGGKTLSESIRSMLPIHDTEKNHG